MRQRIVLVALVAAVCGAADLAAGVTHVSGWLRPAGEPSLFGWACAAAVLLAAASATSLAVSGRTKARLVLAAALVYVAVDEMAGIHERLAGDLDARDLGTLDSAALGLVAYVALLGIVAWLLLRDAGPRGAGRAAVLGGVFLLVAALSARFGGAALAVVHALPAGETRRVGESVVHAIGFVGWILVAAGLLAQTRPVAQAATQSRVRNSQKASPA